MKRWLPVGIILLLLSALVFFLSRTAIDPNDFSGEWYSFDDQTLYLFQEGIIHCKKHPISISDSDSISGAYCFNKDSIVLFAAGINGLNSVEQVYLVNNRGMSQLCENEDGSGRIYFVRASTNK